ncbi:hypothetical protein JOL79_11835 [Microbispora sp. RL4-1S]|uniref:Uncharacterized protein n=1 Tax=Microbispora oryzae TaxID=2806554 RepID=A0A941AQA3_9ACTN|nr:hypothetical protein [Microbispora oryzae]MBP2704504.1 hypothetical protein [Microbispora oryzae]
MRLIPYAALTLATVALASSCGTSPAPAVSKECSEAPPLIGGKLSAFSASAEDPAKLKKALSGAATELEARATAAGDATIRQVFQDFAAELKQLKITNRKSAVEAAQKAIADGTTSLKKIGDACA